MSNQAGLLLLVSILAISIYYYFKVEKTLIKYAIAAFALSILCALLKDFLTIKRVLSIFMLIAMLTACIFSWIEIYKSTSIEKKDKYWLCAFFLPVLSSTIKILFHLVIIFGLPLMLLSLIVLIYYTFKHQKSDYLAEELSIMNLFGIQFILSFVKGLYLFFG